MNKQEAELRSAFRVSGTAARSVTLIPRQPWQANLLRVRRVGDAPLIFQTEALAMDLGYATPKPGQVLADGRTVHLIEIRGHVFVVAGYFGSSSHTSCVTGDKANSSYRY